MRKGKKVWLVILAMVLCTGLFGGNVANAAGVCVEYTGQNSNLQQYTIWGTLVNSYLHTCTDGRIMKVQAGTSADGVAVEYFNQDLELTGSQVIPQELPIFGGFYAAEEHYYLVTGQDNEELSDEKEVIRITQYDRNWKRERSASLYGANTVSPFHAGSLRMDGEGKYLVIRTCHLMYNGHQANVTIQVDTDTMQISDSFTDVWNISAGYVSHSFNEFVKIDQGHIVAVDHGDAYPRAFVLCEYVNELSSGKFVSDKYSTMAVSTNIMNFAGGTGVNATGASAGGFEISSSSYLLAGTSIDQSDSKSKTRNLFVAAVNKSTREVQTNWITSYAEGEESASTPQFVKISDERFVVFWTRGNNVYYTEINGEGMPVGEIYSFEGYLSDCQPVIYNGKILWYVLQGDSNTFYQVDINHLSDQTEKTVNLGHDYENLGTKDGYATLRCRKCGNTTTKKVAESFRVYWDYGEYGSTVFPKKHEIHEEQKYEIADIGTSDADQQMEVISSNPDIVQVDTHRNCLIMKQYGKAEITFRVKYNPSCFKTYYVTVSCKEGEHIWNKDYIIEKEATQTEDGSKILVCSRCGEIKDRQVIPAYGRDDDGEKEVLPVTQVFVDIHKGDWFTPYVQFVYDHKIMTGKDASHFAPGENLVRAQYAVILWRMNGSPKMDYQAKFPDVSAGEWYTDAILWASANGIVTGYSSTGYFGTSDKITREQMAVMMYRYAMSKNYDTSKKADFNQFMDAAYVSEFAVDAMKWAVGNEIITGKDQGTRLDPQGSATRAECATIIMRFMEKNETMR